MTIILSDDEKKYVVMEKFNWHVSKDCPKSIRKTLEPKLKMLRGESYSYDEVKR